MIVSSIGAVHEDACLLSIRQVLDTSPQPSVTMVLLTITAPMLEAIHEWRDRAPDQELPRKSDGEPSLSDPAVGKPISHGQVIELRDGLREKGCDSFSLERLLVGSTVFVPPPPSKPEHVGATDTWCHRSNVIASFPLTKARL